VDFGAQSLKLETEHPTCSRSQLPADHADDERAELPARNPERGFGERLKNSADVKCRDSPNYLT